MKVVVCVKQVPDPAGDLRFGDDGRLLDEPGAVRDLNEWDACAVEEALRLAEAADGGGDVIAVTVGEAGDEDALRRCLAMGVGRAVRIDAAPLAERDPFTIARALAHFVEAEAPDLVLCGAQSSDANHGATGAVLGGLLDLPTAAVVVRLSYDPAQRRAVVDGERQGGTVQRLEVQTPAVITVQTGINEPRYTTLRAIKRAHAATVDIVEPAPAQQPAHRLLRAFVPETASEVEMLEGDVPTVAARIAAIVKERVA